MTREHDPLLRDQWEIGALQQAGNRDVDEPSRYGWLVVVAGYLFFVVGVIALAKLAVVGRLL